MAIIYSYPQATPDSGDMVLGTKFENGVISTNSFYISDIINLVTTAGPQGPVGPTGAQGVTGSAGVAGTAGPVGLTGLNWQGTWASGTPYVADDAVGYGGASWFCILATSGTTTPDIDTTHWALLAAQGAIGATGATGPQGPTGAQGTIGATGPTGGVGTLQQAVDNGSTVTSGIYVTNLDGGSVAVSDGTNVMDLTPTGMTFLTPGANISTLYIPNTITGNRLYELPNASGTIALIGNITLQQAMIGGNTITDGYNTMTVTAESIKTNNLLGGQIEVVGGISNAKPYIKFGLPSSGGKTVTLTHADVQTVSRLIKLPDNNGTIALTSDIPTLQEVLDTGDSVINSAIFVSNTANDFETSINEFGDGQIVLKSIVNDTVTNIGAGQVYLGTIDGSDYAIINKDNLIVNAVNYAFPSGASSPLATLADIPTPAYTKYIGNMNQIGTGSPSVLVFENTIGNIVWTRTGVGAYQGTLAGAFPVASKVWCAKPQPAGTGLRYNLTFFGTGPGIISLYQYADDNTTLIDGIDLASIEIRVYP